MFSVSAETDSEDASQVAWVESVAPSCAICSAIAVALRVAVPSSSMSATRSAKPALSRGLAPFPVRTTISTPTRGNLCDSARITRRPFFRRNRFTSGTLNGVFWAVAGSL